MKAMNYRYSSTLFASQHVNVDCSSDKHTVSLKQAKRIVHNTLTKAIESEHKFSDPIVDLRYVKGDTDRVLVVLKNHDFFVLRLSTNAPTKFCAPVTSIDWGPAPGTVYAISQKHVVVFNIEDPTACDQLAIQHAKRLSYTKIITSPTGDLFCLFNRGSVHIFTAEGGYVVTYSDKIGMVSYTCGCFWENGRQLMLGSVKTGSDSAFVSYIVGAQEIIFLDMQSSKMPTVQMLPNPQKPWLYMLGKNCIQLWTPSRNRLIPSCPIGQQMITNTELYEREDEWDVSNTFPNDRYREMYRRGIFKDEEEDQVDVTGGEELIELPCVW